MFENNSHVLYPLNIWNPLSEKKNPHFGQLLVFFILNSVTIYPISQVETWGIFRHFPPLLHTSYMGIVVTLRNAYDISYPSSIAKVRFLVSNYVKSFLRLSYNILYNLTPVHSTTAPLHMTMCSSYTKFEQGCIWPWNWRIRGWIILSKGYMKNEGSSERDGSSYRVKSIMQRKRWVIGNCWSAGRSWRYNWGNTKESD